MKKKYLILGAGIAGLSASYHLKKNGHDSIILEKKSKAGGLLDNFKSLFIQRSMGKIPHRDLITAYLLMS